MESTSKGYMELEMTIIGEMFTTSTVLSQFQTQRIIKRISYRHRGMSDITGGGFCMEISSRVPSIWRRRRYRRSQGQMPIGLPQKWAR